MSPSQHLAQLTRLIQPPFTNGWWAYATARAEELALERSDCAALPTLLHAERERIKEEASRPPKSDGSSVKQTARRQIVPRETTPARTRSGASKAITGQPALS
ncbi:hypothetical protein ACSFBI_18080 [Variovorax sp. RB3P1]|uniref:hypothetical protein n=1 Tax=Variovorax sp. RB3P1 TaxID=3443732 RepID=UPI003F489672